MSDEGRRVGSLSEVKKINKQGQMFMKTGPTGKQAICLSVQGHSFSLSVILIGRMEKLHKIS